jgi:hypothetical protein
MVVHGFARRLVMFDAGAYLWGCDFFTACALPEDARRALFALKILGERAMRRCGASRNATRPIPKIDGADSRF